MNFTINSRVLKTALESAARVISGKPTIPALAYVLIEGKGNCFTVKGSNEATTIIETVDHPADGKALLPIDVLGLIRTLPDADVTVDVDEKQCKIAWKNGHSTFPAFDPKDYPEIKAEADEDGIAIASETFNAALAHTIPFTASDDLRPIMGGVFFNSKADGTFDIVATDSHTMGLYSFESGCAKPFSFVASANALKYVPKSGDVTVATDDKNIYFKVGPTMVITRKIIGKFPNYSAVIPNEFSAKLTADKNSFLDSLKRVGICSSKSSGHIKLDLGMFDTAIEAQDLGFNTSAKENPENVTYDGADLAIGFNGDFLVKAINAIDSDEIHVKFVDARHAAIVTGNEDESTILIMPVQI